MIVNSERFDASASVSLSFFDRADKESVRIVTRRDWVVGTLPRDHNALSVRECASD